MKSQPLDHQGSLKTDNSFEAPLVNFFLGQVVCFPTSHSCSEKCLVETLPGTEEKARGNTEASTEEPLKSLSLSSLPSVELGGEPPKALGAAGLPWIGPEQGAASGRMPFFFFQIEKLILTSSFDDFTKIEWCDRCSDKQKFAIKASSRRELINRFLNGY